jgi:hypothetical protein
MIAAYHYQITINGSAPNYYGKYPAMTWAHIAEISDNRSITAKLERRLVAEYKPGIEKLYPGFQVDDQYVSTWETFAEIESR